MAQHSNYAQDRDLMMEAYGSVKGIVPKTSSTSLPRGYILTEGHCSDEEKITRVELGGELYEIGSPDPKEGGIIVEIEKHSNGYMISVGEYNSPEDYVNDPDSAIGGYGYALTHDGQPMDEDDLEDGLGHSEDAEGHHHSGSDDGECDECGGDGCDVCNGTGENEEGHHPSGSDDGECDECGGDGCDVCNGTGENEEGGEHAGYSVGDMINGYDGEEIVTAVEADGTIFTRELGDGGNKYTPEEINNLPSAEDGE